MYFNNYVNVNASNNTSNVNNTPKHLESGPIFTINVAA